MLIYFRLIRTLGAMGVASQAYLATAPATLTPTLDRVAALVNTTNLRTLIGQVELDGQDRAVAAQAFLRTNLIIP